MYNNYFAIIPANVRYDKSLKANCKLMYGELTALSNDKGYCWASNGYFAELYGVEKATVSRWISELESKGYVKTYIVYEPDSKVVKERRIYINQKPPEVEENQDDDIVAKAKEEPVKPKKDSGDPVEIKEVFDFWNSKEIIVHKKVSEGMKKAILKAVKEHGLEQVKDGISRYAKAFKSTKCYYSYKWTLELFLRRENGISNWLDEGQIWENVKKDVGYEPKPIEKKAGTTKEVYREITREERHYITVLNIPRFKDQYHEMYDRTTVPERVEWLKGIEAGILSGDIDI